MAEFLKAWEITSQYEGYYSNSPVDKGGETYRGISRNNFPEWPGWFIVDKHKPLKRYEKINDKRLDGFVEGFYLLNFWHKIKGDKILDQNVANFIFDWCVHSGLSQIKKIQRLLNLNDDGSVGQLTLHAINEKNGKDLFEQMKRLREDLFKRIVKNDPTQESNFDGWMNRINSFVYKDN